MIGFALKKFTCFVVIMGIKSSFCYPIGFKSVLHEEDGLGFQILVGAGLLDLRDYMLAK